jgi:choline dehydrogenase-like flavoprotein
VEEISIKKTVEDWVAIGARFSHDSVQHHVKALKEIILCAGSVQSPQLLELSGIGSPDILQKSGIEVKVPNHNVGENLQEHMSESS